jgi:hypothetical protein
MYFITKNSNFIILNKMDDWKEARKRKYAEVDLTQDDDTAKPACKYGENCYRKNPDHLRDFHHSVNKETSVSENPSTSKKNEQIDPKFFFTTINNVPNAKEINKHNSISLASNLEKYKFFIHTFIIF